VKLSGVKHIKAPLPKFLSLREVKIWSGVDLVGTSIERITELLDRRDAKGEGAKPIKHRHSSRCLSVMARSSHQRIVIGYHGCDRAVAARVLAGRVQLNLSRNAYDWLGEGIYFWEHGPERAREWAIEQAKLSGTKIKEPSVLGATINLGECLDFLDTANTRLLRQWYKEFRQTAREKRSPMPENCDAPGSRRGDKVLRFLDRAVIDFTVSHVAEAEGIVYQTVRGVFLEGELAFPGSKIAHKSHIQIAVRDPECILGVFCLDTVNPA
jgi:hypothetical protein